MPNADANAGLYLYVQCTNGLYYSSSSILQWSEGITSRRSHISFFFFFFFKAAAAAAAPPSSSQTPRVP